MKEREGKMHINYFCITAILISFFTASYPQSAVTYQMTSGRFGDQLLAYCHAKWIAHIYTIPLLYKPFKYSDELVLDSCELRYDELQNNFSEQILLDGWVEIDPEADILYVVPFFPESPLEICLEPFNQYYFAVDWDDAAFKQELQKMIYPINIPINIVDFPKEYISIAVHVRKGTSFDIILGKDVKDLSDRNKGPLLFKIPPDSYYIEQIKKIAQINKDQPLYVYIFTDHDNPEQIAQLYECYLKDYPVVFDYRKEDNRHDANVVEDFFSMVATSFDYLIRPESHFSFVASKIGNQTTVISPKEYILEGEHAVIEAHWLNI